MEQSHHAILHNLHFIECVNITSEQIFAVCWVKLHQIYIKKTKSTFQKKSEGSNYSLHSETEVSHMDLD